MNKNLKEIVENFNNKQPKHKKRKDKYDKLEEKIGVYVFTLMMAILVFSTGYAIRDIEAQREKEAMINRYQTIVEYQEKGVLINGEPIDARDFF